MNRPRSRLRGADVFSVGSLRPRSPPPPTAPSPPRRGMNRPRSRLRGADVFSVGSLGLRSRPLRTALSALGVAIGIAAMVAVLGVSASQEQGLLNQIDQL